MYKKIAPGNQGPFSRPAACMLNDLISIAKVMLIERIVVIQF